MPYLNRYRVVNVGYTDAHFSDITFQPGTRHFLTVLENGGGKTTLIKFLLHAILANPRAVDSRTKRALDDYFRGGNRTSHVVMEFQLDGGPQPSGHLFEPDAEQRYIVLGVCFEKLAGESDIRRLTYIIDYQREPKLRLERLPLTREGTLGRRTTRLRELEEYFQGFRGVRLFRPSGTFKVIRDYLKQYHFHEGVWRQIAEANKSEGGFDELVERYPTTQRLVEDFFIPMVMDVQGAGTDSLYELIDQNSRKIARIPDLEKEAEAFAQLSERLAILVERLHERGQQARNVAERRDRLRRELGTARAYQRGLESREMMLKEKQWQTERQQAELNELLALLAWQIAFSAAQEARARLDSTEQALAAARNALAENKKAGRRNDAIDIAWECHRLESTIDALEQTQAQEETTYRDRQGTMQRAARPYVDALTWHVVRLRQRQEAIKTARQEKSAEQSRVRETLRETESQQARQQAEYQALADWLRQSGEALRKLCGDDPERFPEQLAAVEEALEAAEAGLEQAQILLAERETGREAAQANEREAFSVREKARLAHERSSERLTSFEQEKAALSEDLSTYADFGDVLEAQGLILQRIEEQSYQLAEQRLIRELEARAIADERRFYDARQALPPSRDVLTVQARLREEGISTQTGVEWLLHIDEGVNQDLRRLLARRHPLLLISVVLEERSHRYLREHAGELFKDLQLSHPVGLLCRTDLTVTDSGRPAAIAVVNRQGLLFATSLDRLYVPEEQTRYLTEQETHQAQLAQEIEQLSGRLELLNRQRLKLESFAERFPESLITAMTHAVSETTHNLHAAERAHRQSQETLETVLKALEEARALQVQAQNERDKALAECTAWRQAEEHWYRPRQEKQTRRDALLALAGKTEAKCKTLTERLRTLEATLDDLLEQQERCAPELRASEAILKTICEDCKLMPRTVLVAPTTDLQALEARYRAAYQIYRDATTGLETVRQRLQDKRQELRHRRTRLGNEFIYEELLAKVSVTGFAEAYDYQREQRLIEEERQRLRQAENEAISAQTLAKRDCDGAEAHLKKTVRPATAEPGSEPLAVLREREAQLTEQQETLAAQRAELKTLAAELAQAREVAQRWLQELEEELEPADTGTETVELPLAEAKARERSARTEMTVYRKALAELERLTQILESELARLQDWLAESAVTAAIRIRIPDVQKLAQSLEDAELLPRIETVQAHCRSITEHLRHEKQRLEDDKTGLVSRLVNHIRNLLRELGSITRLSRIIMPDGRGQNLIRLEIQPKDDDSLKRAVAERLDVYIRRIHRTEDEDLLPLRDKLLSTGELLALGLARPPRAVFLKPSSIAGRERAMPWEDVVKWSGGERLLVGLTLLMTSLAYRTALSGSGAQVGQLVLLDNPVGKANADHLLSLAFALAEKNNIQLVAFTGLRDPSVIARFHNACSLRKVAGRAHMEVVEDEDDELLRHVGQATAYDQATIALAEEQREAS